MRQAFKSLRIRREIVKKLAKEKAKEQDKLDKTGNNYPVKKKPIKNVFLLFK